MKIPGLFPSTPFDAKLSLGKALLPFLLIFLILPVSSQACGLTASPIPTAEDFIASEQAVIFWDEARKIEHFIRQADIESKNADVGFIVPTPHVPELVEADARLFQLVADVAKPRKIRQIDYGTPLQIFGPVLRGPAIIMLQPYLGLICGMSEAREDDVKIISEQEVAGYHAVILAANDSPALARWLKENGYGWTAELEAWLSPYVTAKWTITAFKLIKVPPAGDPRQIGKRPIVTRAIRMSFATDRPFFPYSEPGAKDRAHAASPYGRALRVALLSSRRMQGALDEGLSWPGELFFAGSPVPEKGSSWKASDWLAFAKLEGTFVLPETLTTWRDLSNPRPGKTDLYFSPSQDQSPFRRTEIDYSLMALHLIDLTDLYADITGLLIAILLPAVPFYCGWRLLRLTRTSGVPVREALPKRRFHWNQILGVCAILLGTMYSLSCMATAYALSFAADLLPGKPMPYFCTPFYSGVLAALMAAMVYCGILALWSEAAPSDPRPHRSILFRWWNYLMAGASLLVGLGFTLAMLGVLLAHFMGNTHREEDDPFFIAVAAYFTEE